MYAPPIDIESSYAIFINKPSFALADRRSIHGSAGCARADCAAGSSNLAIQDLRD